MSSIVLFALASCAGDSASDKRDSSGDTATADEVFRLEDGPYTSLSAGFGLRPGVCVLDAASIPRCFGVPSESGIPCMAPAAEPARQVVGESDGICVLMESGAVECSEASSSSGRVPPLLDGTFTFIDHSGPLICGVGEAGAACSADLSCGPSAPALTGGRDVTVSYGFPGYACALDADGTLRCWGNYPLSGCGTSEETDCACSPSDPPYQAGPYTQATRWLCGLRADGTIDCPLSPSSAPPGTFSFIGGGEFPVGLRTDGEVVYWDHEGVDPAALATPDGTFVAVDTHTNLACGLLSDGDLVCWGSRVDEFEPCE
jgi:hypothetical protein